MKSLICTVWIFYASSSFAASILIPMDEHQANHLKAYGLAYFTLEHDTEVSWLLNYRGGSFILDYSALVETECIARGVSFEIISAAQANTILQGISGLSVNMDIAHMGKAPRIAVYSPRNEIIEDETDAVILVLDYAEIPYDIIYDPEVLDDRLMMYDWLHLHHEDFTGQVDRFNWRESQILEKELQIQNAKTLGFASVPDMKAEVVRKIRAFLAGGGYLFAMCSGAETFDLSLSVLDDAINPFIHPLPNPDLHYDKTLAFHNFQLIPGHQRRYSDINIDRSFRQELGYFTLFEFSAKYDLVPAILTQNHEHVIKEFFGLTTAFNKYTVKSTVTTLGENSEDGFVRYVCGEFGMGHWSYYSGHDPERNNFRGGDWAPTDLNLCPNSPGYRLILNNVLFPSANKKKRKT
ncbi:MAG TPA: hypothetical protein VI583_18260 [Cyclobacteriaceae bacterium]|nr:hypothetical protein [Cyclobacteriaceae bacterium]